MSIALATALGALQAIPSIVALASGAKDAGTKAVLIAGAVVASVLALERYVDPLHDLVGGSAFRLLALLAAGLGIATVMRVQNRVIGALAVTGGCLLALVAWDVVGGR